MAKAVSFIEGAKKISFHECVSLIKRRTITNVSKNFVCVSSVELEKFWEKLRTQIHDSQFHKFIMIAVVGWKSLDACDQFYLR